jgi:hypothetical protein
MRGIYLTIIALVSLSACTVGEQVRELNALRSCKFSIKRIEKIDVAGVDVKEIIRSGNLDIISMPGLVLGLLKGNIPLKTNLVVEITNPTANTAAINELDYKLLIDQHEVVDGTINQEISVAANESTLVPLEFTFDIYKFLANDSIRHNIQNFIQKSESQEPRVIHLTIRIKPGILIGNQLIKYPGFIDIEKTLNSELILSYDQLF